MGRKVTISREEKINAVKEYLSVKGSFRMICNKYQITARNTMQQLRSPSSLK